MPEAPTPLILGDTAPVYLAAKNLLRAMDAGWGAAPYVEELRAAVRAAENPTREALIEAFEEGLL